MSDYSWEAKSKECWYETINKNDLNIDRDHYQRTFNRASVNRITKQWDPVAAKTLTVAKRQDGTYWVVDGQHRLTAAMKLPEVTSLKCIVFNSSGPEEEAKYFVQLNMAGIKPSVEQRFRARLAYGDPVAVKMDAIFEEYNLPWNVGHNSNVRRIKCLQIAEKIFTGNNGENVLRTTLDIIDPLYPISPVDAKIVEGVSYIVQHYDIPDIEALKHGLVKVTRDKLYSACVLADKKSDNNKVNKCHYADAILLALKSNLGTGFYVNPKQRGKKIPPRFPTLKKEVNHE